MRRHRSNFVQEWVPCGAPLLQNEIAHGRFLFSLVPMVVSGAYLDIVAACIVYILRNIFHAQSVLFAAGLRLHFALLWSVWRIDICMMRPLHALFLPT